MITPPRRVANFTVCCDAQIPPLVFSRSPHGGPFDVRIDTLVEGLMTVVMPWYFTYDEERE